MRLLDTLNSTQILSVCSPERLFSGSPGDARQEYHNLLHRWHPDVASTSETATAALVSAHICALYNAAREKLAAGTWVEPPERIDEEQPGIRKYRDARTSHISSYEYKATRKFELGQMFIADNFVLFEIQPEFEDLYLNAVAAISKLRFESHEMAAEMLQYLPQVIDAYNAIEANILILRKTPDQVLLADLLAHLGGRLEEAKHAGWIVNSLLNVTCYLEWAELTHNAISAETVFISPLRHSAMLLGGWWYARPQGAPLNAVPESLLEFVPPDVLDTGVSSTHTDLSLVKALCRSLFGNASGVTFDPDANIPEPMLQWLHATSADDALTEYALWKYSVLSESFGSPRFVTLDATPAQIYKEK